jgi:hypothetical protein
MAEQPVHQPEHAVRIAGLEERLQRPWLSRRRTLFPARREGSTGAAAGFHSVNYGQKRILPDSGASTAELVSGWRLRLGADSASVSRTGRRKT